MLAQFTSEHKSLDENVLQTARKAWDAYISKNLPLLPNNLTPGQYSEEAKRNYSHVLEGKSLANDGTPPGDKEAKVKMHLKTVSVAAEALAATSLSQPPAASSEAAGIEITEFYNKTEDILLPYLDSLYGSSVDANDHTVFTKLTQKFEKRFFEDVRALNCLDPTTLTRVTEYGQQIVDFVKKVVDNNFGYVTSDGSVYFDITAFEAAGNPYARLEPWNRNDQALIADGEGALTKKSTEKKGDADFALWKASKPGEPAWPSPWGPGRPGWHIECSAMASDVLGERMDIHSGGIDLAFPHHDNEIAQSEAFWTGSRNGKCTHQWVNYFLHMGHLSIAGSKMSKSLKNFTTIREALSRGDWTPRGLRIVFLLGTWKDGIEITDDLVKACVSWEDKVDNFFLKALDIQRNPSSTTSTGDNNSAPASSEADSNILGKLSQAETNLDSALRDSFNTALAMRIISDLITDFNSTASTSPLTDETTLTIARWVTKLVRIFGLDGKNDVNNVNLIGWSGVSIPAAAEDIIYPLARLRDEVRRTAREGKIDTSSLQALAEEGRPEKTLAAEKVKYAEVSSQFRNDVAALAEKSAPAKELLALCDRLRDLQLWDLGIYLEDRDRLPALVRPLNSSLIAERASKEETARLKAEAKAKREKEEAEKKKALEEKSKLSHLELFKTAEYSAWDDDGLPVKDASGEELPKARRKKLIKEWEKQKKLHEEWLKGQSSA